MKVTDLEKQFLQDCLKDKTTIGIYHDWLLDQHRVLDATAVMTTKTKRLRVFSDVVGCVVAAVKGAKGDSDLTIRFVGGQQIRFYNSEEGTGNDCYVAIEDIDGDVSDLLGKPLLVAEEISTETIQSNDSDDHCTWTFYRFASERGYITVRWYGTSNGYYSETCEIEIRNGD